MSFIKKDEFDALNLKPTDTYLQLGLGCISNFVNAEDEKYLVLFSDTFVTCYLKSAYVGFMKERGYPNPFVISKEGYLSLEQYKKEFVLREKKCDEWNKAQKEKFVTASLFDN